MTYFLITAAILATVVVACLVGSYVLCRLLVKAIRQSSKP